MTRASGNAPALNIHWDRMSDRPGDALDWDRSILTINGKDRLGLLMGASTYLRDHELNIKYGRGDSWNDLHVGSLVIERTPKSHGDFSEEALRKSCLQYQLEYDFPPHELNSAYELSVLAPDRPGIVASVTGMLWKRHIGILHDKISPFRVPKPSELDGRGKTLTMTSITLTLGFSSLKEDETLRTLKQGLAFLEDRYHWLLELKHHKHRPSEKRLIRGSTPTDLADQYHLMN
jgi:predicted amino acid-binding ACT domain protein